MRAWVVDGGALLPVERDVPVPGPGEVLVKVEACAVCRTDLHLVEGDLVPKFPRISPGHQVVGRTEGGQRVGVAWLRETCQRCGFCVRGLENLCPESTYTGWDAHGGFAEYVTAKAAYVYPLPEDADPVRLAPLLCAGIIGYRALLKADLPKGGRLGVYGFGASAHLAAQLAIAQGATVHVVTRSERARRLALHLGAASAGDTPPEPLDSAIVFAPAGEVVPRALEALDRGGTVAIAGIHLTGIPSMDYQRHLFQERTLRSVTANTRADGRAYLAQVLETPPQVTTTPYAFEDAARAVRDLADGRVGGSAVLLMEPSAT
ncbi:zinc-dependent alcohol dehydrogenase family protein [Nonomuraea sp. NPDC050556]|uniref:zinc-dependent alcohol dehydrogenase family protein n=1 Tax=Nonomuraea sp. NPDC050556 TaxID=3364369 RepID=UPI0037ADADFD